MSWVQDNWNDYYKDKQWIDTKGWCDLDGNPLPFEHDDEFEDLRPIIIERVPNKKTSFFKVLIDFAFSYILFSFACVIFACLAVDFLGIVPIYLFYLFIIVTIISAIRFVVTIIKLAFRGELKL